MVSKVYNELIVQYSGDNFLHYAVAEEGETLQGGLNQKAAFEGFESGDLQFTRFLNTSTNDHVFTADPLEIEMLRSTLSLWKRVMSLDFFKPKLMGRRRFIDFSIPKRDFITIPQTSMR